MNLNQIANFITVLSLIFGFISIIFSLEGHFTFASWAIIISVVLDGIDGQIARKNPTPSEFGKELDSLVDVVSFGLAPSILGYIFIYQDFYLWSTLALFIYLFCSVMRLAKYNITPKEKMVNYFYGLPTTVGGGLLASFILIYRKGKYALLPQPIPYVFLFIVITLALLMISRIKYLNLDGIKELFGRRIMLVVVLLTVVIILAGLFKKAGVTSFTLFLIYVLFAPSVVKKMEHRL